MTAADCTNVHKGTLVPVNENSYDPWDTALTDLTYQSGSLYYPCPALTWSDGLANSCEDHVLDIGPCGVEGDFGQDQSDVYS